MKISQWHDVMLVGSLATKGLSPGRRVTIYVPPPVRWTFLCSTAGTNGTALFSMLKTLSTLN